MQHIFHLSLLPWVCVCITCSVSVLAIASQTGDIAMRIRNKEPIIQYGRHTYKPALTQALPVSPVYSISVSPSLPPTTGSDCDSTGSQPSVQPFRVSSWTAVRKQCQDCYPEHSGIRGKNLAFLLPHIGNYRSSIQHK